MRRSSWDARLDKRVNIEKLEEQGLIADSMEVRKSLVERVMRGEITPEQSSGRTETDSEKCQAQWT